MSVLRSTMNRLALAGASCFCLLGICRAGRDASNIPRPWSFEPLPGQVALPEVKNKNWPKSRIDYFILSQLEARGLSPSPQADRRTLYRRLHFALTGLPPKRDGLAEFDLDRIGQAIDALLASPHYGERWARHWLDLARYTDTTAGWLKSASGAWRYRDWVIRALNDDLPYPEFVKRQLATDLMPETGPDDHVALGFLGLSPTYWKELQLPPEIIKTTVADEWEERVDALGKTFLGLTLACARCHDHKSDPVSMADYYALAGVFASVRIADVPTMADEIWQPVKAARKKVAELEAKQKALKKKKPKPEGADQQLEKLSAEIAEIKKSTPHYDMATANGVEEAALYVNPKSGKNAFGTVLDYKPGEQRHLAMHLRGNPNRLGPVVARRFLSAFPGKDGNPRTFHESSGRLELARAMIEDAEALFARVIVNRVWQQHFGRGLVATPSDFGQLGARPSHPELLDDLCLRLIENGWSLKWLHREILSSAAWQQSSSAPQSESADPENHYFSRMPRRRLDIESYRDAMLAATGELDGAIGGAALDLDDEKNIRRTIYGKVHRRDMNKMLLIHDFPDPTAHAGKRDESISPLQALFALNGPFVHRRAERLAERLGDCSEDPAGRVRAAYRILFQRSPEESELAAALDFLKQSGTLSEYARVLLVCNEFLFLD